MQATIQRGNRVAVLKANAGIHATWSKDIVENPAVGSSRHLRVERQPIGRARHE